MYFSKTFLEFPSLDSFLLSGLSILDPFFSTLYGQKDVWEIIEVTIQPRTFLKSGKI